MCPLLKVAGAESSTHAMLAVSLARLSQHWWPNACAGKMLNGSASAAASGRLWVMPGLLPARQSAGGAGSVAAGVDGGGDQWASRVRFCAEIGLF